MTQARKVEGNLLTFELDDDADDFAVAEVLSTLVGEGQQAVIKSLSLCVQKATVRQIDVAVDDKTTTKAFPLLTERSAGAVDFTGPNVKADSTAAILCNFPVPAGWMLRVRTSGTEKPGKGSCLQVLFYGVAPTSGMVTV